jgi:hypothetical protein
MQRTKLACAWALIFILSKQVLFAQPASEWKAVVGTIAEKEFMGRKALYLSRGLAYLPKSSFDNGVIEVDIAGAVMAGITFRVDEDHNYEEAYIRVPKSGGQDALQYGPVFNGEFSWQFYPEYQAAVVYPKNEWIHLKIVVINKQAAIYAVSHDSVSMLIDSLRTFNSSGHVGVWSLSTGAYFSNFTYRVLSPADMLPVIAKKTFSNPDAIKEWQVSYAGEFISAPAEKLDEYLAAKQNWKKAITEPDGYLNINKYATKKIGGMGIKNSTDITWIRYEWEEKADGLKPVSFEYSNRCFMYLNNRKIFAGNNSFLLKGTFFRGDIDKEMKANTVFLPVQKGRNDLMVAVVGSANGWGFMAQFADGSLKK